MSVAICHALELLSLLRSVLIVFPADGFQASGFLFSPFRVFPMHCSLIQFFHLFGFSLVVCVFFRGRFSGSVPLPRRFHGGGHVGCWSAIRERGL